MANIGKFTAINGTTYDIKDAVARSGLANKANATEAIKDITRNGTTFTVTRCDNTAFTFDQQDVPQNVFIGELSVCTDPNTMVTWYEAGIYTWKEDGAIPSSLEEGSLFILYTNVDGYTTDEPGTSNYLYVGIDVYDGTESMLGYPVTRVSNEGTWGAYRYSNETFTRINNFDFSFVRALLPTKKKIVDMIYPVGSIYMSVNQVSPSSLFGGTWVQIKDRFLLGVGDTYGVSETTGGSTSVKYTPVGSNEPCTLTTAQIPSHNHTFTGIAVDSGDISQGHTHTGTTGNQSANHKHTTTTGNASATHYHSYDKAGTPTGSTAITLNQTAKHSHQVNRQKVGTAGSNRYVVTGSGTTTGDLSAVSSFDAGGGAGHTHTVSLAAAFTGTSGDAHTHTGTSGDNNANHTHTMTTGTQSQGHTHSVTAKGTIGSSGGGEEHNHLFTGTESTINIMPPYFTVYMWRRTA